MMDVVEKYFADKGKVAIWDAEITLEELRKNDVYSKFYKSKIAWETYTKIYEELNPVTGKRILDVGCGVGWFTFIFTECQAFVTGVESDPIIARVAEGIKSMKGHNCEIVNTEINRFLERYEHHYDAVLLLNVFDQMLRTNEEDAWKALQKIRERSNYVFLMAGATEQLPNMAGIRTEHPKWVPLQAQKESWEMGHEMILRKSGFKECKRLLRNSYAMRDLWLFY